MLLVDQMVFLNVQLSASACYVEFLKRIADVKPAIWLQQNN